MALRMNEDLGHYRITTPLGAGGMGEVYRATDTRLGREVAIKVLPAELAEDSERLARFKREAKVLASLNHPNIATLFGLETHESLADAGGTESSGTTSFLVMELVEGEDLARRIAAGPVPIREVSKIAAQIAKGLDAAHTAGIVHRDIKPANIRITPGGTVKVLDFGLAKALVQPSADVDFSDSPTVTTGMTRAGTVLGTAPYLSPEQARGEVVDSRTDIWALGCVLYEMLTGQRAFPGNRSTEILVQILGREPDWSALPPTVPSALRRLLGRCLEKEPERRLRDARDLALALEDLEPDQPLAVVDTVHREPTQARRIWPWLMTAAAVAIIAMVGWIGRAPTEQPKRSSTLRFTEASPAMLEFSQIGHDGSAVAISPDGQVLAWIGATGESTQLFARYLDDDEAQAIAGGEGAKAPFFSPDSEWLGFWADGKLKKVAVSGGVPQTICEISHIHGVSWGDGVIVFGAIGDGSLWRVDPAGGQVKRISISNEDAYRGGYPTLLPGSDAMLVSSQGQPTVDLVSLQNGEVTTLVREGSHGSYLATGHLLWTQGDSLLAAPFDLSQRMITGEARTVIKGIATESHVGFTSHYAVSQEGTLAYIPGSTVSSGVRPAWVRLDGTTEPLPLPPSSSYLSPRISPDGRKLLISCQGETRSVWLVEPDRGVRTPVTGDDGNQFWAIWTPDGAGMVFNSQKQAEPVSLWMQPFDRSKAPKRLTNAPVHHLPQDMTQDGHTVILIAASGVEEEFDIYRLDLDGEPKLSPLLASSDNEFHPTLSPDDHWLAYVSDVTGTPEVYVQPFPDLGATVRVSPNGGMEPLWSPSGDRLYYRSVNGRHVLAVDVLLTDPLQFGREELLFEGRFAPTMRWGRKWDIHPDGDRFLILQLVQGEPAEGIRVVTNWFAELQELVPSNR